MSKASKPQIRYEWRRQPHSDASGNIQSTWRVCWSLYGANGEFMCGDGGQGYESKAKAQEAADRCGSYLFNRGLTLESLRTEEVGPGRRPPKPKPPIIMGAYGGLLEPGKPMRKVRE